MLFTIGTSNRTSAEFFGEVVRRDVWLIIDVRSSPFSRNPWARGSALEREATRWGLRYTWSGAILGGRNPISPDEYEFQTAAAALLEATDSGAVAIFCSEGDPTMCHRSYKVAAHLLKRHGVEATNILRDGSDERLIDTLSRTPTLNLIDRLIP